MSVELERHLSAAGPRIHASIRSREEILADLPSVVASIAEGAVQRELNRELPHEIFRMLRHTGLTYLRILVSVGLSFVIFVTAGILAGLYAPVAKGASPLFVLIQGIPAICWTIFAILWFRNNEVRIAFIVCISTGAVFFFQLRDAVAAIPGDLRDMAMAWRPTRWQMIRKLVLPAVLPVMLTTTLVNLGIGLKVGVTAELLASASGIGNELRDSQELFRVDQVIGWTVPLVIFVIVIEQVSGWANRRYLAWRPTQERAA